MNIVDLYNLFNGSGESDMIPKERKIVDFIPDAAPLSLELLDCSG